MELTLTQNEVLAHPGDLLVIGGPGSGKTTVGLRKAQMKCHEGLKVGQAVLFLSFSNSAIYQIQQAARITLSASERAALQVRTFHSFCWELLQSHGYLLGLPRRLTFLAPEEVAARSARVEKNNRAAWERTVAFKEGRLTFDLFAPLAKELLQRSTYLCRLLSDCFPLVIVDEFQDTDDDQWQFVHALSAHGKLVALADQNQRIHDYRPGVSPRRLHILQETRTPKVITLTGNHRSPSSDHLSLARHVLDPNLGPVLCSSVVIDLYKQHNQAGVRLKHLVRKAEELVRKRRGDSGKASVLVLGRTNATVRQLSGWLNHPTPKANFQLHHDAFVDAVEMVAAWHVLIAMLDSSAASVDEHVANVLNSLADFFCGRGNANDLEIATKLTESALLLTSGSRPKRTKVLEQILAAMQLVRGLNWCGDPVRDLQSLTQAVVANIDVKYIRDVIDDCGLWSPLKPGSAPNQALQELFRDIGSYRGAREAFRKSYALERMADRFRSSRGRNVMTLHKCKGKEFDAVVIFDGLHGQHRLASLNKENSYDESRRLLHVGITRARYAVYILTPENSPCPLLPERQRLSAGPVG